MRLSGADGSNVMRAVNGAVSRRPSLVFIGSGALEVVAIKVSGRHLILVIWG